MNDTILNDRGNTVTRRSSPYGDRYAYDFDLCPSHEGWEQFDTWQDASYFGVWCNKEKLSIVTYAEGDEIVVVCPDAAHYNAEIESMCEFYEPGYMFIAYEEKRPGHWVRTEYRQDRNEFFIGESHETNH